MRLLTVDEVTAIWGCHRITVLRLMERGVLDWIEAEGEFFFEAEERPATQEFQDKDLSASDGAQGQVKLAKLVKAAASPPMTIDRTPEASHEAGGFYGWC